MNTKIMIAGGVGALGLVGILLIRARSSASNAAPPVDPMASSGLSTMLYGPPAISGGISSGDSGTGGFALPGMGTNTDGTTMGVASMDQLMAGFFANTTLENMARIQSNTYTADTSSLSGINYGLFGGSGTVQHNSDGTVVTVKNNTDPNNPNYSDYVDSLYQSVLGRAPDAGGKAFYLDAIKNGMSVSQIAQSISNSPEHQAQIAAQNAAADKAYADANAAARSQASTTTTTTNPTTGVVTVSKSQA